MCFVIAESKIGLTVKKVTNFLKLTKRHINFCRSFDEGQSRDKHILT